MINRSSDFLLCLCTVQGNDLLCLTDVWGASWLLHQSHAKVLQALYPNPASVFPGHSQDFYSDWVNVQLPPQTKIQGQTPFQYWFCSLFSRGQSWGRLLAGELAYTVQTRVLWV